MSFFSISRCSDCTDSAYPCTWCVRSHKCTHDRETCGSDILVTGRNVSLDSVLAWTFILKHGLLLIPTSSYLTWSNHWNSLTPVTTYLCLSSFDDHLMILYLFYCSCYLPLMSHVSLVGSFWSQSTHVVFWLSLSFDQFTIINVHLLINLSVWYLVIMQLICATFSACTHVVSTIFNVLLPPVQVQGPSDRVGPDACPKIENSSKEILVPSGKVFNVSVRAINLQVWAPFSRVRAI